MTFRKGVSGNPAGRPKGSKNHLVLDEKIRREVTRTGQTPLEAMLAVMRSPREKVEVRLDAAKAAAPYVHRKMPVAVDEPMPAEPISITGIQQLSIAERKILLALLEKAADGSGEKRARQKTDEPLFVDTADDKTSFQSIGGVRRTT